MPKRKETLRQSIINCLETAGRPLDFRELSVILKISEKELPAHLEHVEKSLRSENRRLVVVPATCKSCGYAFTDRSRPAKPSRCPQCRSERIDPPRFTVQ